MSIGPGWGSGSFRSGTFRVRPHRPVRTILTVLVLVALLTGGAWWLYDRGLVTGGYQARMARATEAHLRLDNEELRERIDELTRRNTLLERADRIDRDAIKHLREEIETREARISELEEELTFYRNLVSPSETGPGLHVRRISVVPVPGTPRRFRYELVLTQLNGNDRYVKGRVDLGLTGRGAAGQANLAADEFVVEGESSTYFRFKYFQTLAGVIELPESFTPANLQLKVVPAGGRVDPIEENFSWKSLISEGA
ncbi:MAG: DUF6776 family protein [Halofilum sp. (in: g-proteobacteria)]|nr:DUF6776 family protein [Halofilum sp. (in: g-proteobacteria)]